MTLLLLAASIAAVAAAPAVDVCDRRADIEAIRSASDPARAELRKRFDDDVAKATGRAHACAAAVAAEAAIFDGDKARTLVLLEDVVAGLPELGPSLAPHRALLLAELARVPESEGLLATLPENAVAWRARIELALARAKKDSATTTILLKKQATRDANALAALCDDGDDGSCRDLLLRHAGHPAARAREAKLAARVRSPARTRALLAAGRPKLAAAESAGVVDPEGVAERTEALLRLGLVAEAIEISKGPIDSQPPRLDYALAKANAKARTRAADVTGALARYDEILSFSARADVDKKELAEAAFFAAFTLIEADDVDAALPRLEAAGPFVVDTPWEVQVLWQRAFLLLSAKSDAAGALPIFDALIAKNDKEVRKHRYWRARALDVVDKARGKAERQALVSEDPVDWYGLLARRDLRMKTIAGSKLAHDALQKLVVVDDEVRLLRLLFALGFDDEARDLARARGLRDARVSLANIGLAQSIDDANFGWKRGGLYLPAPPTKKHRLNGAPAWRVSYPMPWLDLVDVAAVRSAVPRSFVYAIMRTESGFDGAALSNRGARGALQLLPSVARALAEQDARLPKESRSVDDDIALGSGLLGLMVKEHGSLMIAAAAYNGAPENAQAWVKRFGHLPVDVFVERVPFKETRDYIKRVLAAEAVYRGLDGGEVSLALPAQLTGTTTFTLFPYDE
ncbi:MAG: lytic transglycosylase domain-containing protein [Deltaproteobacteria bacterium]|nr:lytic transglycosylase domain-containing protein [Deltaproteobacteria bacterium]